MIKIFENIKKFNDKEINYLNKKNCNVHCQNNEIPLHKCGNKLIMYGNIIICFQCKKAYKSSQIKLFCFYCKTRYYTTIKEKNEEYLDKYLPVSFVNYLCEISKDIRIPCIKCGHFLYYYTINNNIKYNNKELINKSSLLC